MRPTRVPTSERNELDWDGDNRARDFDLAREAFAAASACALARTPLPFPPLLNQLSQRGCDCMTGGGTGQQQAKTCFSGTWNASQGLKTDSHWHFNLDI
jgi:hypothetical protein